MAFPGVLFALCSGGTQGRLAAALTVGPHGYWGLGLRSTACPCPQRMTAEAQRRVVVEYLRAVMQKRISFRSPEERKEGADRMVREAEQLRFLFRKLASVSAAPLPCQRALGAGVLPGLPRLVG